MITTTPQQEISEQIQQDIIAYCEYMDPEKVILTDIAVDELCQIVVDNFREKSVDLSSTSH